MEADLDTLISVGSSLNPFAGTALRLSFHDCSGPIEGNADASAMDSRCDGCIEFDSFDDHKDLEHRAVEPLEDIYFGDNEWDTKMSRADFWAFAGTYAVKFTANQAGTQPAIPYFFGRQDCATSPDVDVSSTTHKVFPSALAGWDATFAWFNASFGYEPRDVVAILGSHTIGRAHSSDSGFTNPWTFAWGTFNNDYYQDLEGLSWFQQTTSSGKPQWSGGFMMLNIDVALLKDIDPDQDGFVSCTNLDNCPDNPVTAGIVREFADDEQAWLDAYAPAFKTMITSGYSESELECVGSDDVCRGFGVAVADTDAVNVLGREHHFKLGGRKIPTPSAHVVDVTFVAVAASCVLLLAYFGYCCCLRGSHSSGYRSVKIEDSEWATDSEAANPDRAAESEHDEVRICEFDVAESDQELL